jgi:periplasmic glucans biosynthesis protein
MFPVSRRTLLAGFAATGAQAAAALRAQAQAAAPEVHHFSFDDVVKRARDLASAPFDPVVPPLPKALAQLDFDAWRDIRFRPERALTGKPGSQFRLQTFHLGHLFKRPVTINVIRDGVATPIPYSASLFDYGRTKFDKPLPVNLGFAGFRIHYPLNNPKVADELIAFVGSSYFRFLGRGQQYGLSGRGLSINTGLLDNHEEFPFYREFWVDLPDPNADHVSIYALLDSVSLSGAYRFDVYPCADTYVDVTVALFARTPQAGIGFAPLTSMYFMGENDRHYNDRNRYDDYRPEMHDSDGLLLHSANGDWTWRPLRNPFIQKVGYFDAADPRGFGLMQRDRSFDHYQDIELAYEQRPSYWIEPRGKWGAGRLELVELATKDETADNIVLSWRPKEPITPDKPANYGYRITSYLDAPNLPPGGRVINTFSAPAKALGSGEQDIPGTRRFLVDFAGGDISYFLSDPGAVEISASASNGRILRSFVTANPRLNALRAAIDVQIEPHSSTDMRMVLKAAGRSLTETWAYTWNDEGPSPPQN